MGITYSNAALLAEARNNNVCFDTILTIGHLTLYLSRRQISKLARRYGVKVDSSVFSHREYADRWFEIFLGAKSVTSLDYSQYEQCDIVHDMNYPVDPSCHEKFDVVIDGGTLEHIFNFPVAVENCMRMVKKGGSLFLFTIADNHTGHGFYQFSPELFFRIFQPANGYEIRDVILERHPYPGAELSPRTRCFSVVDPARVKKRVGLVCGSPVTMMVHAVRTESKALFAEYPIQSDYASRGDGGATETGGRADGRPFLASLKKVARKCFDRLPLRWRQFITGRYQLSCYSFSNRDFYERWR